MNNMDNFCIMCSETMGVSDKKSLAPVMEEIMRTLKQGTGGDDVTLLQEMLKAKGYIVVVDGKFGPGTKATVIQFQKDNKLKEDGIVGPITLAYLQNSKPKGYQILQANKYTKIIKIPLGMLEKIDVVDSIGPFETVISMQKRTGADIMVNGILYGMVNGKEIAKFIDEGVTKATGIFSKFCMMVMKDGAIKFGMFAPDSNIRDCIGFAPSLVIDGKINIDITGFEKDMGFIKNKYPRLAFGINKTDLFIAAVGGRKPLSGRYGMSGYELADLMLGLGCENAGNLDGGGSVTVVDKNGRIINDALAQRAVANGVAFFIKKV